MPAMNFSNTNKRYYSVDKVTGKIRAKIKTDEGVVEMFYDYMSGRLVKVERREEMFENRPTVKIQFHLANDNDDYVDVLQGGQGTAWVNDILNRLANVPDLSAWVRITPYLADDKNDKSKKYLHGSLRVCADEDDKGEIVKGRYFDEIPAPKTVVFQGKNLSDDSDRRVFFDGVITEINKRIPAKKQPKRVAEFVEEEADF